jgi:hypothetical protein
MILDGRLFPEGIEHSSFHDNQEYTFGEKTFLIATETEKVLEI